MADRRLTMTMFREWGRRGGLKGGRKGGTTTAARMTPEERTARARKAALARHAKDRSSESVEVSSN
jgi:hypothetical protein